MLITTQTKSEVVEVKSVVELSVKETPLFKSQTDITVPTLEPPLNPNPGSLAT